MKTTSCVLGAICSADDILDEFQSSMGLLQNPDVDIRQNRKVNNEAPYIMLDRLSCVSTPVNQQWDPIFTLLYCQAA